MTGVTEPGKVKQDRGRRLPAVANGALIGALTAGAALAAGEAVAVVTGPSTAPIYVVGGAAVNLTPAPLKEFAIAHFGENDKTFLVAGILATLAVIALAAGIAALRRLWAGVALVLVFGAVGVAASVSQSVNGLTAALPSVVGALAGVGVLLLLVHGYKRSMKLVAAVPAASPQPTTSREAGTPQAGTAPVPVPAPERDRRGFVVAAASVAAGSAVVGFGADLISSRRYDVGAARAAVRLPPPAIRAPALPAGVHPEVPGLSSFFTDNADFYRVDTALVLPQVNPRSWTLRVDGMVDKPFELTFDQLLRMPLREHDLTVSCVSDPVGGPYVGTARWLGVSLPGLLRSAGVRTGADQLIARSVDGMTIGTPLGSVLDGREALIAVAMNGEALPIAHGFPARMLVPGFYGYASACKWVTELTVTSFAAQRAYWVRRGYAEIGTMKTQSRVDVPKPFARVAAGPVTVAGVAWATDRGISAVQIRIDQGPWLQARLAAQDSPDTWRQWTCEWQAVAGTHNIEVRAADDSGQYQTGTRAEPLPNGASGWESVVVTVH